MLKNNHYKMISTRVHKGQEISRGTDFSRIQFSQKARDWLPKFATGLNMIIGCNSKSMYMSDQAMRGSFWQNNSLVTHILFELQPIITYSPVANFGNQSIVTTPTSFSIFDSNYMKSLWFKVGYDIFADFKMARL